jgi:hypothetical protein
VIHQTPAERLDHALDRLAEGDVPRGDPELRSLLETALLLERSLAPVPASDRFEEALAARLVESGILARNLRVLGAVLAAFVVWRGTRRSAGRRLWGH